MHAAIGLTIGLVLYLPAFALLARFWRDLGAA